MDDWTRVLLYGTFDGFAYSTDDFPRTVVVLDSGERVEVPEECVVSADRMINKNKIKLKDVIARIKELDLGTQKVWLNEILNELGSDYGTLKYKDGYEQGKFDGAIEREKVTVPQFVADWYEEYNFDLEFNIWDWIKYTQEEEKIKNRQFTEWLGKSENDPVETLVKMKLFGYDVEEEKRYLVKVKGVNDCGCYLNKGLLSKEYFWESKAEIGGCRAKHTRKQLEDDDFGWVFDCEGIEIEEVENE